MTDLIKALIDSASQYGPAGLIAAVFIGLYYLEHKAGMKERAAHIKTSEKLLELSTASIKADTEHTAAIATLSRVLDSIDRRLS